MLRLKNLTISVGDDLLCENQSFDLFEGVCAIVGGDESLKNAMAYIFTNSPLYGAAEMVWDSDLEMNGVSMNYTEFKEYLNPFIHFDQKDTVKSTIMFANHSLYEKIISDFKLEDVENKKVVDLNVSAFRVWEMAMAAASQAKIVYVSQTFTSRRKFKYLLSKLKEYLRDVGSYIFVEVHDFVECKADYVIEVANSHFLIHRLVKNGKHKSINKVLLNTQNPEMLKVQKKKDSTGSNAFIKAYITGEETSSSIYSSFETPTEITPPKRRFVITSLFTETLASCFLIFKWLGLFVFVLLRGPWRALNISLRNSGFTVLFFRCFIFFNRKSFKTDKFRNYCVSLGVLIYFYFSFRFIWPLLKGLILLTAFVIDILLILLCIMIFCKISKFSLCYTRILQSCSLFYSKKDQCLDCSRFSIFTTSLSSGKCLLTRMLLRMTKKQGEYFFDYKKQNNLWIDISLSLCFHCTPTFYNWLGDTFNLNLEHVLTSFYEAWTRPLTNFESQAISFIMMFSISSFNYNLISEDFNFLKESLYITIHPFTYYVYVLSHTFTSTLPLFIFSLLTNSLTFLPIYYNFLLVTSVLNSFVNMTFKIIIISVLIISQFLYPDGFFSNVKYPYMILYEVCKFVVCYSIFCVFISVYRK